MTACLRQDCAHVTHTSHVACMHASTLLIGTLTMSHASRFVTVVDMVSGAGANTGGRAKANRLHHKTGQGSTLQRPANCAVPCTRCVHR